MQSPRNVGFTSPAMEGKPRQGERALRIGNDPVRADPIVPRPAIAVLDHRDPHRLAMIEHHACASILLVCARPRLDGTPHGRYKGHPPKSYFTKVWTLHPEPRCLRRQRYCARRCPLSPTSRRRQPQSGRDPRIAPVQCRCRGMWAISGCARLRRRGPGSSADRGAVLAHHRRRVAAPRLHLGAPRAVMAHAFTHPTPCRGSAH